MINKAQLKFFSNKTYFRRDEEADPEQVLLAELAALLLLGE